MTSEPRRLQLRRLHHFLILFYWCKCPSALLWQCCVCAFPVQRQMKHGHSSCVVLSLTILLSFHMNFIFSILVKNNIGILFKITLKDKTVVGWFFTSLIFWLSWDTSPSKGDLSIFLSYFKVFSVMCTSRFYLFQGINLFLRLLWIGLFLFSFLVYSSLVCRNDFKFIGQLKCFQFYLYIEYKDLLYLKLIQS